MIYFVRRPDTGRIKIGTTIRLSERLKQLASEAGCDLEVLAVTGGSYDAEKALHLRFSELRHAGEWFEPGDDLLGFIVAEARPWDGKDQSPKTVGFNLKMSPAYRAWLEEAASHCGLSLSDFMDQAARKYAKAEGFTKKPPER